MSKEIVDCNNLVGQYKDLLSRDTEKLAEFGKINKDIMDVQVSIDEVRKQATATHNIVMNSGGALGELEARLAVQS